MVSEVTRQLIERDEAGRKKYGTTLDRTDLSLSEWLQHMAEELLDAAGYALAAKREAETPSRKLWNEYADMVAGAWPAPDRRRVREAILRAMEWATKPQTVSRPEPPPASDVRGKPSSMRIVAYRVVEP